MNILSQATIEKIGYYVYLLIDPRNQKVFYVGKGKGNRINQHFFGALDEKTFETEKIKTIRNIEKEGLDVIQIILRHGLNEKEAFEIESAMIDFLGKKNLTNIVNGHDPEDKGIMNLKDIEIKYQAKKMQIDDPVVLININQKFDRNMSQSEIYEATRSAWKLNVNRAKKVKIVLAVFRSIIREVFIVDRWIEVGDRYEFDGKVASSETRDKYLNKNISEYQKKGSQNPIKYINC